MVVIIGAGISGLSTGYFLQKNNIPFVILEASERTGGYIKSVKENNYLLEIGPNSLLIDSEIEAFLSELNLANELIEANDVSKDRFIFKNGKYRKLPSSPPTFLFSNFFSFSTKIAVLTEFFRKPKSIENESLAAFIERRFCKEIVDYAVAPFISGIYAGYAADTNAELAFPTLVNFEKEFGSVLKGVIKSAKTGRKKTVSFKNGLQTLTDRLTELLESSIVRKTMVNSIKK
jgi:protoporphyrinogen/coproporphyrinogen III oxidase